ncbi:MAG TPA: hypothetical protein VFF11_00825, partial [Candidatus Binatia bacterium]|nr:hypothetical protein [Candidatus Binatia bacterium]
GVLQVKAAVTVPTAPEPILYGFSGNTLSLSWTNANWRVEMQTNSLSKGLGTNWTTLVPANSGINNTNVTVDPTKPTVFYRLVYP